MSNRNPRPPQAPTPTANPAAESPMSQSSPFVTPAEVGDGTPYVFYRSFPKLLGRGKVIKVDQTLLPELRLGFYFMRYSVSDKKTIGDLAAVVRGELPGDVARSTAMLDGMVDEAFSVTRGQHPDAKLNDAFKAFYAAFKASPTGTSRDINPSTGKQYAFSVCEHIEAQQSKAAGQSAGPAVGSSFAARHLVGMDVPTRPAQARGGIAGLRTRLAADMDKAAAEAVAKGEDPIAAARAAILSRR